VTDGLLSALSATTSAWTTGGTWWLFSAATVLALLCLARSAARLGERLVRTPDARRDAALGAGLLLVALALRLWLPERVHYTYNDEYEYLDHAQRLLASRAYGLWTGPPAGVYAYALGFAAFGPSSDVAFVLTIVAGSLSAPALAWALGTLGVARPTAVVAGLLLAVAPLHVKHAASASLEVLSLLAILLAVGSFGALLRAPDGGRALAFAICLFFALTVRVENWALLPLLLLLAGLLRRERAPLGAALLLPALVAVALAALYLPGIVDAPIRYDPWWKSRLPAVSLLAANLSFWVAGDPWLRKLPLAIACVGLVAGLARSRTATVFWLAYAALYSVAFVLYGLNVGWVEEAHQPPPWGAREAGHDMFRFDVLLLPAVLLLLASGLVALARAARDLVRGAGFAETWPAPSRAAALAGGGLLLVALVASGGEWRSYRPLAHVASRYNRGFEIAELHYLRGALARHRGALFVLPPSEGVFVDGIAPRPLAELDASPGAAATERLVYVNGRQLAVPELRATFLAAVARHRLVEVDRAMDGSDRFFLFAVPASRARHAPASPASRG